MFELHTAITMGRSCNVDIILTKDQLAQFKQFVGTAGYGGVDKVLFNKISSRRATATVPADLEAIRNLIEQSVGYDRLDESVIKKLRDWQVTEAGAIASASMMRMQMGAVKIKRSNSFRKQDRRQRRKEGKSASLSAGSDSAPDSPTSPLQPSLPESDATIAHVPAQAAALPRASNLPGVVVNRRASLALHEDLRLHDLAQPPPYPFAAFRKPLALDPLPHLSGTRRGKQNKVAPIPTDATLFPDYEFRLRQSQKHVVALSTATAVAHVAPLADAEPRALPKAAWRGSVASSSTTSPSMALPTRAPLRSPSLDNSHSGRISALLEADAHTAHILELRDRDHGLLAGSGFSPAARRNTRGNSAGALIRPGTSSSRGRRESGASIGPRSPIHSSDHILTLRRNETVVTVDSSDESRESFDVGWADGHSPKIVDRNVDGIRIEGHSERESFNWSAMNPASQVVRIDSLV